MANHWDKSSAVWLVPSIGISNTLARVACGVLSSMPGVDALLINNVALTLGGLTTMVSGLYFDAWYQFTYTTAFGIACGKHVRGDFSDIVGKRDGQWEGCPIPVTRITP